MVDLKVEVPNQFLEEEIRCGHIITAEMKKVWAIELDLLAQLLKVCKKHQIKIVVTAGTLLGAIRHGGFIPWDDDLDVMMSRKEYDKLCKIASQEFTDPYFFQTEYTDPGSIRGHAQLRNSDTAAILDYENGDFGYNQGIFIDIFVWDTVPNDEDEAIKQQIKINKLRDKAKLLYRYSDGYLFMKESVKRKLLHLLIKPFAILFPYRRFYKKFESECKKNNAQDTIFVGLFSFDIHKGRFVWNKSDLEEIKWVDFEFLKVPIPVNYNNILIKTYGNYMEPVKVPSEHGKIIFNTDISYKEYLGLR